MNGINATAEKPVTGAEIPVKDEPKAKKFGIREKLMLIRSNITVEPIIACYIMSNVFSGLAVQNLNLEKACRVNLGYDDEVCSALNKRQTENYTLEESEVQKLTASVQAWKNIVQTTFPCILILFVGSWSDKTGKRKACILLPIVGEVLCCTSFILNTYFFYELPLEITALSDLFPSLTGGWITVCVGVFSYIGDITTLEMRTFRVGVANLCMSLGIPIGMSLSGILLQKIGYYGIFLISNCLYLTSLIYGYIRLKDPVISSDRQRVSILYLVIVSLIAKISDTRMFKSGLIKYWYVAISIRNVEAIHHLQSSSTGRLVLCLSDKLLCAHYANSNEGGHRNAISVLLEARIGVDSDLYPPSFDIVNTSTAI